MSNLAIPSWSEVPALNRDIFSFQTPKTDAIKEELALSDTFQKRVIEKHHKMSPFRPNEAEKIIAIAARNFGKEAALWTLKYTEEAFREPISREYGNSRNFFPFSQLRVLRFLTHEFQSQDFSLEVLKTLKFYDVPPEKGSNTLREVFASEIYWLLGDVGEVKRWPNVGYYYFLPLPVVLLGDRFGKQVAQGAADLSKSHFRIKGYLDKIQQVVNEQPYDQESWKKSIKEAHICEKFHHPDKPYLTPQQAIDKIKEAARCFGKEVAEWTLEHVHHSFSYLEHSRVPIPTGRRIECCCSSSLAEHDIYPLHQLEVLEFFIDTFKCSKTALNVLKKLCFYYAENELPERRRELQIGKNGEHLDQSLDRVLKPIIMIGQKFGKEAAEEAIEISTANMALKSFLKSPEGKEKMACSLATFGQKTDLSPSCIIL